MRNRCFSLGIAIALAACGADDKGPVVALPDARPFGDAASNQDGSPGIDADLLDDGGMVDPDGALPVDGDPVINEIVVEPGAPEFFEIYGDANTDYSAFTLLQIDGDDAGGSNTGLVLTATAAGTTGANQLALTDLATNTFQDGSGTYLLVEGWSGTADSTDIDTNDDGTIDVTPWTRIVDAVAFDDLASTGTDLLYTAGYGPVLDRVKGAASPYGGASRIPDGTDTDGAGDWVMNARDGTADSSAEANRTPGEPNTVGVD